MAIQKLLLEEGVKRSVKATREYYTDRFGYDFFGLISRLLVFFLTGFLINAYFQATIQGGIWLNSAASFFGFKFPDTLPLWVTELFTTGVYGKITFWQIVQVIGVLIVVMEYLQYEKMLKIKEESKPNASTTAVFTLIALGLSLITFPTMINKIREMRIVNGSN